MKVDLDKRAVALRPVRVMVKQDTFRYYEATTFPKAPWSGCHRMLRKLAVIGGISSEATDLVLDILDEEGDVIQDFNLTKKGFEYLRRTLKFKVDRRLEEEEVGDGE